MIKLQMLVSHTMWVLEIEPSSCGASGSIHQTEELVRLSRLRPQGISEKRMAGLEPAPVKLYLFWNM